MKKFLLLISIFSLSCTTAQNNHYGYVFRETTGITSYILNNGNEIPIQFSSHSDKMALRTLRAMKWNILYPNSDGHTIFLVGILEKEVKKTPVGPNYSDSQMYQFFILTDWYIKSPFKQIFVEDESTVPHKIKFIVRKNLKLIDFDDFEGKNTIDLSKFQIRKPSN